MGCLPILQINNDINIQSYNVLLDWVLGGRRGGGGGGALAENFGGGVWQISLQSLSYFRPKLDTPHDIPGVVNH